MASPQADAPSAEALARSLAATFPGWDDAPLARALLRALARGEPVSVAALAASTDRAADDVTRTLARWSNVHRDERGRVEAFCGLSLRPTEHRFEVGGVRLYTWCAWDALFLPALLDEQARVESTCAVTGVRVSLTVAPEGVLASQPEDVWVSFPPPARASTANIVESFCRHVHFLAGREVAARWADGRAGSLAVDLDDAFDLGRAATR
jgi:alkylmercury lyase